MANGLSVINTLCIRSVCGLPSLRENNQNHQKALPRGRVGFPFRDVTDRDDTKHQTRGPFKLTNGIISTDER